jgi:hypothetical protein
MGPCLQWYLCDDWNTGKKLFEIQLKKKELAITIIYVRLDDWSSISGRGLHCDQASSGAHPTSCPMDTSN